ncbi:hypothetical protein BDV95DRAFT_574564 [Massariosphaeria phaeospora]|uniref:Uncharacterized protein n=1 Tax=Massariosphaeria phaeospora TaxID=100035 RepID=A0A7C8M7F9_9PLEO|nr:hypothetical protein BDV95DRAFT_574564 [Massariosphaeria phaeospora]
MQVRSLEDTGRSTILVNVNLEKVKNQGTTGKSKKFTFRLEGLPAFCSVSLSVVVGFCHNAFQDDFSNIQQMFNLTIPMDRRALRL